jgi:hypothetical protein
MLCRMRRWLTSVETIVPVSAATSTLPPGKLRIAVAKFLGLIVVAVIVPTPVLAALGVGATATFIGLGGVGAVVAVLTAGVRVGLLSVVISAIAAISLTFASVTWWSAAVAMAVVAGIFALTAKRGWQGGFVPSVIALSFIASEGSRSIEPLTRAAVVLGIGFLAWGAIMAGLTYLFFRKPVFPAKSEADRTVAGYALMLIVVTFVTQGVAIGLDLGHTGGWLVMTPFLVILPHLHDGFMKSLRRAAGTVGGFIIVMGLSLLGVPSPVLSVVGIVAFTAALFAKLKNWNYFYFALFLTPGIVILESSSSSLTTLAEYRLEATLGAIALSLFVMGVTTLFGRTIKPPASPIDAQSG